MGSFVQFHSVLFTKHFSSQIVHLLLIFLGSDELVKLLGKDLGKRPEAPDFFFEANGPKICVDFVAENPDKAESILRLIVTAASYEQRPVNNFMN